jgi:hypothetical protein
MTGRDRLTAGAVVAAVACCAGPLLLGTAGTVAGLTLGRWALIVVVFSVISGTVIWGQAIRVRDFRKVVQNAHRDRA